MLPQAPLEEASPPAVVELEGLLLLLLARSHADD